MGTRKTTTGGQHSFAKIPNAEIQRSKFNRSCGYKTTFNSGDLIPFWVDEALPGDTMNMRMHNFTRLATPLHPIMDNMYLDTFFFAVPIRLLWDNWQKFNGEQDDPGDSTDFTIPVITEANIGIGTISDYMGIPTELADPLTFNALHHRAYNLIWNEFFRDQNLQDSINNQRGDGPDGHGAYGMQKRGKRHDYFTSCLPFAQKGQAVTLPLGTTAPVVGTGDLQPIFYTDDPGDTSEIHAFGSQNTLELVDNLMNAGDIHWSDTKLEADLTTATAATINEIRQAFQVQRLLERDARGGSRYTEIIRAHFGVTSPDQRLQRPEYLGGGTQRINVTAVPQTSETDTNTPQGNLAAYGTSQGSGHAFMKSFTEHCVLIGLVSVRADLNYQQGLPRMFSRQTRFDFYWPALAHLGEQAVLNKEIFAIGDDGSGQDEAVFGYQERFAEYRYSNSKITGEMRSTFAQSLDTWHLAQDFATLPVLDDTFIKENPPIARIIAVPSEPEFLFDAFLEFTHARPMPTFSVPGLIDHF